MDAPGHMAHFYLNLLDVADLNTNPYPIQKPVEWAPGSPQLAIFGVLSLLYAFSDNFTLCTH